MCKHLETLCILGLAGAAGIFWFDFWHYNGDIYTPSILTILTLIYTFGRPSE